MKAARKEIECIKYALTLRTDINFYSKLKFQFLTSFDVSSNKYFSQLWMDHGLQDTGKLSYIRGPFDSDLKLKCILKWTEILFSKDVTDLYNETKEQLIEEHRKFIIENPGVRIKMIKAVDILPERIDGLFGKY